MQEPQTAKLSLRLDARIYAAIQQEARVKGRETDEHIQRILTEHAIGQNLLDDATGKEIETKWSLVQGTVDTARRICREGGFARDIIHKAILECMADKRWAADYESFVKDNPFKHGNPRKGLINKEIGLRIRKGIGGKVTTLSDGKPSKVPVVGSIIQSYTEIETFESDAVK
jgi:hypothetical protein